MHLHTLVWTCAVVGLHVRFGTWEGHTHTGNPYIYHHIPLWTHHFIKGDKTTATVTITWSSNNTLTDTVLIRFSSLPGANTLNSTLRIITQYARQFVKHTAQQRQCISWKNHPLIRLDPRWPGGWWWMMYPPVPVQTSVATVATCEQLPVQKCPKNPGHPHWLLIDENCVSISVSLI